MVDTPFLPVPESMDEPLPWLQRVSRTLNSVLGGKQNVVINQFALEQNVDFTVLTDSRIGVSSYIGLMPLAEDAASDPPWISSQQVGSATLSHSNDASPDRIYRIIIFG